MTSLKFPAKQRLKSKKQISLLFKSGQSLAAFPVLAIYQKVDGPASIQVAFSVPKKHFKKAVDRNLIKRRMKESWRLRKNKLNSQDQTLQVMLIFIGKEISPFKSIDKGIKKLIRKIN